MIFNLVSGTSGAVFKQALHLSARSNLNDGVTFEGVIAPAGSINGLVIFANVQESAGNINNIYAIINPTNYDNRAYFQSWMNADAPYFDAVGNAISYDAEAQELTITCSHSGGAYLAAGDYTLIIW